MGYSDIKPCIVDQPGHRRMVIARGFHDHTGLTVQTFEQLCQIAQFTGGMPNFVSVK